MLQQKRSDALWRLAGDISIDDRRFVRAALVLGGALLIPGQPFGARFGRVVGSRIAVEETNGERTDGASTGGGETVPIDAAHEQAIRRLVTLHWDDAGAGALVVAPLCAGHALYVVTLSAPAPARRSLTADDDAFAEHIATLIGERVQRKWDAVRRDPLEVVTLR